MHQRHSRRHRHGAQAVLRRVAAGLAVLTAIAAAAHAAGAIALTPLTRLSPAGATAGSNTVTIGPTAALTRDGSTAFTAGYDHGVSVVWVFGITPFGWRQIQELRAPSTGPYAAIGRTGFGGSVAVSGTGSTLLVGAPLDNQKQGAVWVYARAGGNWTVTSKLVPPLTGANAETSRPGFGTGVAVSAAGSVAAIGGPNEGGYRGAAWIADLGSAGWQIVRKLTVPREGRVNPFFGYSLAVSDSGRSLLVGASGDEATFWFTGAGTRWSAARRVAPPRAGPDRIRGAASFGEAVALSGNGRRALVGAPGDRPGGGNGYGTGAAWIFDLGGRVWHERAKLLPAGHRPGPVVFGYDLALSADGSTALVGAPDEGRFGGAYVFTAARRGWQRARLSPPHAGTLAPLGTEQYFGSGAALSRTGSVAAIADGGLSPGNVWIYVR